VPSRARDHHSDRPLLFVDVDGVISIFGFAPDARPPGRAHPIRGVDHYIGEATGGHLKRLAERFELVWATGWEDDADRHLPDLLGLARGRMHTLTFGDLVAGGPAHWKIEPIERYAGDRPTAWIDDNLDERCVAWAEEREAPTLLIHTDPAVGVADEHVDELLGWADELARGRAESGLRR
jgi:hypothetical protein